MAKVVRNNTSGSIQLSPNFYLSEFTHSDQASRRGIVNSPDPLAVKNLFALAEVMEKVRKLLGNRVIAISSGFRSLELNTLVGGSPGSEHMRGMACDFHCNGYGTPLQIAHAISKSSILFGQLIQEGDWVHLSLISEDHDCEVMTAKFANGNVSYKSGL